MPVQQLEEMAVDSAQYRVTPRSMMLRRTWLRAEWYCVELDSAQYHTARSQSQNLYKNQKYFNPLLSGQGRLELCKKNG